MIWYYYLNYRIYKYYKRKKDNIPVFTAFLISIVLLYMNIFSILSIIDFLKPFLFLSNKLHVLTLMLILAILNYLVLYKGKYYTEVFNKFDNESEKYKIWNNSVVIYIIASIFLMLIVLGVADYRHDGSLS